MTFPPFRWSTNDDEIVLLALVDVGRANRLSPTQTSAIAVKDHATHWLLFIRFVGYEDPAENGYQLHAWPKDQIPFETFAAEAKTLIDSIKKA